MDELTPTTSAEDAARRVLALRLQTVCDYLARALQEAEKDTEYVHQLRVGTRRSRAALDIFGPCLPPRVSQRAKKGMRNLRRAAGVARDWDVFILDLTERAGQRSPRRGRAGLDFLLGYGVSHRLEAQATLERSVPDSFAVDRLTAEILHAIRRPEGRAVTLVELARPCLLQRLEELDQAAGADLRHYDNLHQVRIAGKRLRYAMEIFAGCFSDDFRSVHYAAVEEMQEILGRANDSHVASQRLEFLRQRTQVLLPGQWKRYKSDFNELMESYQRQQDEALPQFQAWWQAWADAGGRAALIDLLTPPQSMAVA